MDTTTPTPATTAATAVPGPAAHDTAAHGGATRAERSRRHGRLRRLVAGVALVGTVTGAAGTVAAIDRAEAINPAQTTSTGVFNLLSYSSASYSQPNFWKWVYPAYRVPSTYKYSTTISTMCGTMSVNNSFFCPSNNSIYLSLPWNQTWINQFGDYAAGGISAHEFGHSVASYLGRRAGNFRDEYFADCLAGVYTRYGYSVGRLVGSDYGEMWNWLNTRAWSSTHGLGSERAAWYRYGYQTYSITDCLRVFGTTAARAATADAEKSSAHEHDHAHGAVDHDHAFTEHVPTDPSVRVRRDVRPPTQVAAMPTARRLNSNVAPAAIPVPSTRGARSS